MSDFLEDDESKQDQPEAPRIGWFRPASRAELVTSAVLLVVSLLAVLGALLFVSTDADSEPFWIPWLFGGGAALAVNGLALLMRAAQQRRTLLAESLRLAMWLEAHDPDQERWQLRLSRPQQQLLVQARELRDALLASGDVREADRLNAALPASVRQAWVDHGIILWR